MAEHFGAAAFARAGLAGANAMVQRYDEELKTVTLIQTTGHPSAPGEPPALESGRLRDSLRITRAYASGAYTFTSSEGPTAIYASVQEYGAEIWAKHPVRPGPRLIGPMSREELGYMRWVGADGEVHYAQRVTLPPRPYVRPTVEMLVESGELTRVSGEAASNALLNG